MRWRLEVADWPPMEFATWPEARDAARELSRLTAACVAVFDRGVFRGHVYEYTHQRLTVSFRSKKDQGK